MGFIAKKASSEVVAKTAITADTMILNKSQLPGITRKIQVSGLDANTVVREYTKDYDLMQNATVLLGSPDKALDWDDSTADSVDMGAGASETDWIKFDLGAVKTIFLYCKIGVSAPAAVTSCSHRYCRVYVSEDGSAWTLFLEKDVHENPSGVQTASKGATVTCRYIKITYENTDGSYTGTAYLYTIEAFEASDANCKAYTHIDSTELTCVHTVQTKNEKVSVIIFTTNCNYRIVDLDALAEDYIEVT